MLALFVTEPAKDVVKKSNKASKKKSKKASNASASHFDEESELLEEYNDYSQMSKHGIRQKEMAPPITFSRHATASMKERSPLPGEHMHKVVKGSKVVTVFPTSRPVKYNGIAKHQREAKKQSEKRMKGLGGGGTKDAENVDHPKGANAMSEKAPISELTSGQELTGKVINVKPYGAFVDIGYQSNGLLRITKIADDFVSKVHGHILVVNQEVNVRVISVDTTKNWVALTMRSIKAEEKAEAENAERRERRGKGAPMRSGVGEEKEREFEASSYPS